jgi:hypothetical protein
MDAADPDLPNAAVEQSQPLSEAYFGMPVQTGN